MASSYKLELARFSTLLRNQDRAKCGKGGGDTAQKTDILEGGEHRTYLIEVGTLHTLLGRGHHTCLIGVETPHIAYWGGDTTQH